MTLYRFVIVTMVLSLTAISANAGTLKFQIKQMEIPSPKTYQHTCNTENLPCRFTLPVHFVTDGSDNNIDMEVTLQPYTADLRFFWGETILNPTSFRQEQYYYFNLRPRIEGAVNARLISLFMPQKNPTPGVTRKPIAKLLVTLN